MTASNVRSQFIQFFLERGHTAVASSRLVPQNDPTLLFTNAGMVQFKSVFLGEEKRPYSRAVSVQKSLRAGGKHNDLEIVGHTARHHTFFEMLGNFSFGDYFKKEAISFGWELLTDGFRLPVVDLWATVYKEDHEAADLWKKYLPVHRIVYLGEKDNFWQMGETGPCGPCSEILIDQGAAIHPDCPGIGQCECDRYLEIWNLVFMQYNRDEAGRLSPLPKPSIDTGMGLERISAVCQGVTSNYQTDLFRPLFFAIAKRANKTEQEMITLLPARVIADHLRAITFLISDGVIPQNEGRGYVLRRILRRAARFGRELNLHEPFLHELTDAVIDQMGGAYPELLSNRTTVARIVLAEEERFVHTLNQGYDFLSETIATLKHRNGKILPGERLFQLYDTHGFPFDLASEVAKEEGLQVDEAGFNAAMERQREMARRSWTGGAHRSKESHLLYEPLLNALGETDFVGYESLTDEGILLALFKEGQSVQAAREGDRVDLVLHRTPFYGESGGQVGDRGVLSSGTAYIEIEDTIKPLPHFHLHRGRIVRGAIHVGETLRASVSSVLRQNTARHHTATHLLHAALREALGEHVKQAGSRVAPERLRFDFQHVSPVTPREISRIEEMVNEQIWKNAPVQTHLMEVDQAIASGAVALFGERYESRVRVVQISDFSRELCGGTHCGGIGEIGFMKIIGEGGVAAGIRRIEAVTGPAAYQWMKEQEQSIREVSTLVKGPLHEVVQQTERLVTKLQEREKEIAQLKVKAFQSVLSVAESEIKKIGVVSVWVKEIAPTDMEEMRRQADTMRDRLKSGIIVLGALSPSQDKAMVVVKVTPDWTSSFRADQIAKEVAILIDGNGGGKAEMAQAGGKKVESLSLALEKSIEIIRRKAN